MFSLRSARYSWYSRCWDWTSSTSSQRRSQGSARSQHAGQMKPNVSPFSKEAYFMRDHNQSQWCRYETDCSELEQFKTNTQCLHGGLDVQRTGYWHLLVIMSNAVLCNGRYTLYSFYITLTHLTVRHCVASYNIIVLHTCMTWQLKPSENECSVDKVDVVLVSQMLSRLVFRFSSFYCI